MYLTRIFDFIYRGVGEVPIEVSAGNIMCSLKDISVIVNYFITYTHNK